MLALTEAASAQALVPPPGEPWLHTLRRRMWEGKRAELWRCMTMLPDLPAAAETASLAVLNMALKYLTDTEKVSVEAARATVAVQLVQVKNQGAHRLQHWCRRLNYGRSGARVL